MDSNFSKIINQFKNDMNQLLDEINKFKEFDYSIIEPEPKKYEQQTILEDLGTGTKNRPMSANLSQWRIRAGAI